VSRSEYHELRIGNGFARWICYNPREPVGARGAPGRRRVALCASRLREQQD
jgi:hypothetical protein